MAARAALGRALLASGTTIVGLGAATMLVSSVSMGIAKVVVTENKKKTAVSCGVCHGHKKVRCDICSGEKVIRYHPFKALPLNNMPMTACAMCGATGEQVCLNCLGDGYVSPHLPGESSSRSSRSRGSRGHANSSSSSSRAGSSNGGGSSSSRGGDSSHNSSQAVPGQHPGFS